MNRTQTQTKLCQYVINQIHQKCTAQIKKIKKLNKYLKLPRQINNIGHFTRYLTRRRKLHHAVMNCRCHLCSRKLIHRGPPPLAFSSDTSNLYSWLPAASWHDSVGTLAPIACGIYISIMTFTIHLYDLT